MATDYEEKILVTLIEAYRKSKKDSGSNTINRRTKIVPEKLYANYHSNVGDFDKISAINEAASALSAMGFVKEDTEAFGTELKAIYLVDSKVEAIEEYLFEKYGYEAKSKKLTVLAEIIEKYQNSSDICMKECELLKEKLNNRVVPNNLSQLDDLLKAIAFIENNKEELYLREVSMKVYGDSKYFENNTLDHVCGLLRKYHDFDVNEELLSDEILSLFNVSREPQKLSIKGKVTVTINGHNIDISAFSSGIDFTAKELSDIQAVKVNTAAFMTVENRTAYMRYHNDDMVVFYLGGYANRYQRDFIKMVYKDNPDIVYYHFGDIDAGGFFIHQNLCDITGVPFVTFGMSVNELMDEKYKSCLHKLTNNDISRLKSLLENVDYYDVIKYMLDNDCKLEQEIVSLYLMSN